MTIKYDCRKARGLFSSEMPYKEIIQAKKAFLRVGDAIGIYLVYKALNDIPRIKKEKELYNQGKQKVDFAEIEQEKRLDDGLDEDAWTSIIGYGRISKDGSINRR